MSRTPSPGKLLEIAAGYQRAKVLLALIELEIPTILAPGARAADEVAVEARLDPVAADRFLSACVALGLLARDGDRYANAPDTQHYLVHGSETDLGDYFLRQGLTCYPAWSNFTERLREWRPGCAGQAPDSGDCAADVRAQHRLSLVLGEALGEAVDLSRNHCLLDLGGGSGATSIALCRRHAGLRSIVLELPEIAAVARAVLAGDGLARRTEVRDSDFMR